MERSKSPGVSARMLGLMALLVMGVAGARCGDGDGKAHVGSRSCDVIGKATPDPTTHDACSRCQAQACSQSGCDLFPCLEGVRVIQGCQEDTDCSAFPGTRCGHHSGPDLVCSTHPDDR
jgi:hypothetical protein